MVLLFCLFQTEIFSQMGLPQLLISRWKQWPGFLPLPSWSLRQVSFPSREEGTTFWGLVR